MYFISIDPRFKTVSWQPDSLIKLGLPAGIQPSDRCRSLSPANGQKLSRLLSGRFATEHGKPSAYLVDVEHFEEIQRKLNLLEGLARGEKAILEGRVVPHEKAKERMARWLK